MVKMYFKMLIIKEFKILLFELVIYNNFLNILLIK